jgi:uncharacterized DUF497 family protein
MVGYRIGGLEFEWDDEKAEGNIVKHGVSFLEAASAFLDRDQERIPDIEHSEHEDRFLLLAESFRHRILVVSHTARGRLIRLISARVAKPRERRRYEDVRDGRR